MGWGIGRGKRGVEGGGGSAPSSMFFARIFGKCTKISKKITEHGKSMACFYIIPMEKQAKDFLKMVLHKLMCSPSLASVNGVMDSGGQYC